MSESNKSDVRMEHFADAFHFQGLLFVALSSAWYVVSCSGNRHWENKVCWQLFWDKTTKSELEISGTAVLNFHISQIKTVLWYLPQSEENFKQPKENEKLLDKIFKFKTLLLLIVLYKDTCQCEGRHQLCNETSYLTINLLGPHDEHNFPDE
jgi:hypothetical protein